MLGLGTQIRPHIERRFSMPWSRPAARMREMVLAIRAIWASWQHDAKLDFRGEFYTHTLMTPVFNPGPNPYGLPPHLLRRRGPRMTEVAGEVADGFFVHPFHSVDFLRRARCRRLQRGLDRAGRAPQRLRDRRPGDHREPADNDEEFERSRTAPGHRSPSTARRRPTGPCSITSAEASCRPSSTVSRSRASGWRWPGSSTTTCSTGSPWWRPGTKSRRKLAERYGGLVDRISLVSPMAPDEGLWEDVVRDLADV